MCLKKLQTSFWSTWHLLHVHGRPFVCLAMCILKISGLLNSTLQKLQRVPVSLNLCSFFIGSKFLLADRWNLSLLEILWATSTGCLLLSKEILISSTGFFCLEAFKFMSFLVHSGIYFLGLGLIYFICCTGGLFLKNTGCAAFFSSTTFSPEKLPTTKNFLYLN